MPCLCPSFKEERESYRERERESQPCLTDPTNRPGQSKE
jgi:hypothetical protein